jgi:hypothetical protein
MVLLAAVTAHHAVQASSRRHRRGYRRPWNLLLRRRRHYHQYLDQERLTWTLLATEAAECLLRPNVLVTADCCAAQLRGGEEIAQIVEVPLDPCCILDTTGCCEESPVRCELVNTF